MFTAPHNLRRALIFGAAMAAFTSGCAPSAAQQQGTATAIAATVIAQITASAPTQTATTAATDTPAPTDTPVATLTRTPVPTSTPRPTWTPQPTKTAGPSPTPRPTRTPVPGTFRNPISIGQSGTRRSPFYEADLTITVLDVKRGKDAIPLARKLQSYLYKAPIEKQEYLLIKIKIQWLTGNQTKQIKTFNIGDFALRYENDGDILWPESIDKLAEGYVPFESEGWLQFLIREGSRPVLYVQPELEISKKLGRDTDTGLYYSVEPQTTP